MEFQFDKTKYNFCQCCDIIYGNDKHKLYIDEWKENEKYYNFKILMDDDINQIDNEISVIKKRKLT